MKVKSIPINLISVSSKLRLIHPWNFFVYLSIQYGLAIPKTNQCDENASCLVDLFGLLAAH